MVMSNSGQQPHYVCQSKACGYLCDDNCIGNKSSKICSHTVAAALKNGTIASCIRWYQTLKCKPNFTKSGKPTTAPGADVIESIELDLLAQKDGPVVYPRFSKLSSLALASIFSTSLVTFFDAPLRLGFWPAVVGLPLSDSFVKFGLHFKVWYYRIKLAIVPFFIAAATV